MLGLPEAVPAHDYFGQLCDTDGTVLLCLHAWGGHDHPSLQNPDYATPGNSLLLFFRVDDFDATLKRPHPRPATRARAHLNPGPQALEFSLRDLDEYFVTTQDGAAFVYSQAELRVSICASSPTKCLKGTENMDRTHWILSGIACLFVLYSGLVRPAHATQHTTYFITDIQGTVVATTNSQGNVIYTAAYRPYGKQQVGSPQLGPGYAGHINDPETELIYMQARYYDPSLGRFLSTDPAVPTPGNSFNFNRYVYVRNNPIRYIDPNGYKYAELWAKQGVVVGAGVTAAASVVVDYGTGGINIIATPAEVAGGGVAGGFIFYNLGKVADFVTGNSSSDSIIQQSSSGDSNKKYYPAPKSIKGIKGLTPAKPKTSVQGGGGLRKRWKGSDGKIYEWDSQHGTLEEYDKQGNHLGEVDPDTGDKLKPKTKGRKVEK